MLNNKKNKKNSPRSIAYGGENLIIQKKIWTILTQKTMIKKCSIHQGWKFGVGDSSFQKYDKEKSWAECKDWTLITNFLQLTKEIELHTMY